MPSLLMPRQRLHGKMPRSEDAATEDATACASLELVDGKRGEEEREKVTFELERRAE